uniref:Uncharacterized protein n=1 Tax=viral metagenome TaxID=1070528 RepID=A0A6C0CZH3_9ZZZZ
MMVWLDEEQDENEVIIEPGDEVLIYFIFPMIALFFPIILHYQIYMMYFYEPEDLPLNVAYL